MNTKTSKIPPRSTARSAAPTPTDVPAIEISDNRDGFAHRIVCGGVAGQWAPYTGIATLKVGEMIYHAATDYYHGTLPTNKVFTVREV